MTTEEFDDLPSHRWVPGYIYELINGVLVVSPHTSTSERSPNEELGFHLRLYKETHLQGSSLDDTLPEHTVVGTPNRRRCDRAIWAGLGRQLIEDADIPTIIVEFVSRSKQDRHRDYVAKRSEYHQAGAIEYWIFDRFHRKLTAIQFSNAGFTEIVMPESGTYQTVLLPGFVLSVAEILKRADAWPTPRMKPRPRKRDSQ